MTTMPIRAVNHAAPQVTGVTAEVITVSTLLTMPAVWTAVVERELPAQVLLERFLIVLLTCALLAELVRRLGEGGALSHVLADSGGTATPRTTAASPASASSAPSEPMSAPMFDEPADDFGFDDLGGVDAGEPTTPLALDTPPAAVPASDLGELADLTDLGDFDLAPLDLDADPF